MRTLPQEELQDGMETGKCSPLSATMNSMATFIFCAQQCPAEHSVPQYAMSPLGLSDLAAICSILYI